MNKELEKLLEDLDSGEEVKTKYGICYAYSPNVVEELKQALTEKQIKEAKPSEAMECLEKIKNRLFERFKSEDFSEDFIKEYEKLFFEPIKQALLKQLSGSQYTNIFIDEAVKPSEAFGNISRGLETIENDLIALAKLGVNETFDDLLLDISKTTQLIKKIYKPY